MAHLSKCAVAPKFTNKKEDWPEFVRKYEIWVRNLSSGKPLPDAQNLQLFLTCLPESFQEELQLWEAEKGRPPTFTEFFAN